MIKNAVPAEQAKRMADLLWEFEEKDTNNKETWYAPALREIQMKELTNCGMMEIYNHQFQ